AINLALSSGLDGSWVAGEKIVGWRYAASGATFKGIAPEVILDVLALIDQKVSAAKNHPVVQDAVYQAEIDQQWKSSEIIPRGRG
ncbi:MAG TPA: hypothetical protein VGU44_01015, partial [Gammaproteobacteria bacterium]|nr:hypothetical protein [Gammaproteobacteria bacterium]